MHLVIYFCGTGNPGENFYNNKDYLNNPQINTLFVNGCEHPNVCNSSIFPDLKSFASRFAKRVFKKDPKNGGRLFVSEDQPASYSNVGVNDSFSSANLDDTDPIESITLCGYSRGAVTCFEVAKQLNKIAPNIPVDIVADQPVPGNSYQGPGTNAGSIADCSNLKNLRNVSIILGAYTGTIYEEKNIHDQNSSRHDYQASNPETHSIHRGFFSQIVPKLPREAKRDLIVIPRESHHQTLVNSPDGSQHMHMQIARYLNNAKLVSATNVYVQEQNVINAYKSPHKSTPTMFPPQQKLQSIFGFNTKDAYLYMDSLHPSPNVRMDAQFLPDESLLDWWKKHDKQASPISSPLTKKLVKLIKETDMNDTDSLKALYIQADKWLLAKSDMPTSRYYQVEALRNNLHDLLVIKKVAKPDLAKITRQNMSESNYFLKHWKRVSETTSRYKTDATRELDKAFKAHATTPASAENDQRLMDALDKWIDEKKDSTSKRWEDVITMKELLSTTMKNTYGANLNPAGASTPIRRSRI